MARGPVLVLVLAGGFSRCTDKTIKRAKRRCPASTGCPASEPTLWQTLRKALVTGLHREETRSAVPGCLPEPGCRARLEGSQHRASLDGGPWAADGLPVSSGSGHTWSFGSGVGVGNLGFTSVTPKWCVQGFNLVPGLVRNRSGPV